MKISRKNALQAAIAYADVFDYPLTSNELELWAIGSEIKILQKQEYYYLQNRKRIINFRLKREKFSQNKWQVAKNVCRWLKLIPTIKLVGVTGGLAMNNADENDDIDLFFITSKNSLWISRLLSIFVVSILGKRRRPNQEHVKNLICLNMFMSEENLSLLKNERDLFSAHEVLQMAPLWERENVYQKFLNANNWVKNYLPNAWKEKFRTKKRIKSNKKIFNACYLLIIIFEFIVKLFQLWYMKKRRSAEVITNHLLRFHPHDARIWIKKELNKRLKIYNIPLDKIFYDR